jgi:hypothetical protein
MRFSRFLRFLHGLPSLPVWPWNRAYYFTHGLSDGKAAASSSRTTLSADSSQVAEQAIFAAAALPGRVVPDDVHTYRLGWIEGYRTMGARGATSTGQ